MKCLVCGSEFKAITSMHLTKKHNLTPAQYLTLYHEAVLYPPEVRSKIASKHLGKTCSPREPMTQEQRMKLSIARTGLKTGPSSDAKKAKQRENWAKNYESRCESIRNSYTPERREKQRQNQKNLIAERGYHLARGRETRLERLVREHFEDLGFSVKKQKQTRDQVLGSKRYFDVFVQDLNLIVEIDGEYWHTHEDRLTIDVAKEQAALKEGYNFIRVSDSLLKRGSEQSDLAYLLNVSQMEARAISAKLFQKRREKLEARRALG